MVPDFSSVCSDALLVSVIIPVWKEEQRINNALDALLRGATGLPIELIIVDGDPEGETLNAISVRSPTLTPVRCFVSQKGRANQMNCGARQAIAPILLFLHVDTQLPEQGIHNIVQYLKALPDVVGGAFDLDIDSSSYLLKVIARVSSWRSRLTRLPYGDQGIFIRRAVFEDLGGFAEVPLMEDVILMQSLKQRGMEIRLLRDRVLTSARRWEKEGVIQCTVRNWILILLFLGGVQPKFLARFYRQA